MSTKTTGDSFSWKSRLKEKPNSKSQTQSGHRQTKSCGKCTNLQNVGALIDIASTSMDDGEKEIKDCAASSLFLRAALRGGGKRGRGGSGGWLQGGWVQKRTS